MFHEQKGARSGWIIQNIPCSCQLRKKTRNKWCEYQKRSKLARRGFSLAYQAMTTSAAVMIQPVTPGPVVKFAMRKTTKRSPGVVASGSTKASSVKLTMCAAMWTKEKKQIPQPTALWNVIFLSKGM